MRPLKILIVSLLILSLLGSAQPAQAANNQSIVIQLDINGVINPFSSRYLERGLDLAQRSGAELVLVTLDTPGGLEASMREMVQAILGSPVPVVVYVTPAGARATSARLFILQAGDVAAMAPATQPNSSSLQNC